MQTLKATIQPMQRISAKVRAASAGRGGSGTEVVKIQYGFFDTDTEVVEVHYQNVISGTLPLAFKGTGKALDNYKIFGKSKGVGVQLPSGKYRIPLSVNGSAINIDTNSPLYEGEYLSYLPDKTLPVIPTAAGDNIISANFTKTSLIGDGEDDLSNWNKNMSSFPIFENSYENGCNSLVYQGGSGYERIYLPVTINGEITFSFDYKTSGHNCSYGGDCNYAFISTAVPDTSAFLQMAGVVVSERLETAASDTTVHHNLSYSGKGLVYIGFDFGYIVDGITITLNFDHITVEGIKDIVPEIEITGEITESEGH